MQNKFLLQMDRFNEVYAEIDSVLPSLEYCLAPKKQGEKKGALRSAVGILEQSS